MFTVHDLPDDVFQVVINCALFDTKEPWVKKLKGWHSTMLVSKTWFDHFRYGFRGYAQNNPNKIFTLLHERLKFNQHDSWLSKKQAKHQVISRNFLSQLGGSITKIYRHETSFKTCEVIAKYCTNLHSLKFYSLVQNEEKMVTIIGLISSLTHLNNLTIDTPVTKAKDRCFFPPKSSFVPNLQNFSQIKYLKLSFELTCLDHLTPLNQLTQLEKLTLKISECSGLILNDFITTLVINLSNLTKLVITLNDDHPILPQSCLDCIVKSKVSRLILSHNFAQFKQIHWLYQYFPLCKKGIEERAVRSITNTGILVRKEMPAINIFERKFA